MNEISKAAAKEALVEAAEAHARNLTRVADELEKYEVNTSSIKLESEFFVEFLFAPGSDIFSTSLYLF